MSELVSVIIPCYRSEATIEKVVAAARDELRRLGHSTQFVLVNDCSPDGTFQAIDRLAKASHDVVGVDLARNFGQHGAIMCGLSHATGSIVLLMDDDMQTHPSQIPAMLSALTDDRDVVFGKYPKRREAAWRRLGSSFWRWSMRVMTGCPKSVELTSFVALRGWVAREMVRYDGPYPVIQGLVFRITSRVGNADVRHFERASGTSGYTLRSLVRLWSNVVNFSLLPLRFAMVVGMGLGVTGLAAAVYLIIRRLLHPEIPMGWSSLMVTMFVCSGIILVALGMVGEYVGRIFMTSNRSPQFVERTVTTREGPDEAR